MSEVHSLDAQLTVLESEWRALREAALIAQRECDIVAQRLRAEANLFEIAKESLEIAEILEKRSLAKLESYKQRAICTLEQRQSPSLT